MRHTEHADTRAVMARGQYTDKNERTATATSRPLHLPLPSLRGSTRQLRGSTPRLRHFALRRRRRRHKTGIKINKNHENS